MAMINCEEMEEEFDRGRMYERYREKREAKLRQDWLNRIQHKEAQIRATWQRLEQSQPSVQQISESSQDERKTRAVTISRGNSFKKQDSDQKNVLTISPSSSRPQTRNGNKASVRNDSSSISSPRNLLRSRTVSNSESKQNGPIRTSHQRRNTLTHLELEINSDSDSLKNNVTISKPFLKKGSGIGPGFGPSIVKQRTSVKHDERKVDYRFESCDSSVCSGSEYSADFGSKDRVGRERKKWVAPEKLEIFSSQAEKEESKLGFRRVLLNVVGKSKKDSSMF